MRLPGAYLQELYGGVLSVNVTRLDVGGTGKGEEGKGSLYIRLRLPVRPLSASAADRPGAVVT